MPWIASPPRFAQTRAVHFLATALASALLLLAGGCGQPPSPAAPAQASTPNPATPPASPTPGSGFLDDGRPQTGLPRIQLFVGPEILDTELALTTAAIQKGMMWRTNVAETSAMLFVFGRAHQTAFWMKNVPIDIDVAYLDPEGIILEIHRLERFNTNPVAARTDRVQFALETAEGWFKRHGIGPGTAVRTERGSLGETFFARKP